MKTLYWLKRSALLGLIFSITLAIIVMLTWEPDRQLGNLAARWATTPSRFVEIAGMQVHIRDIGPRDDPEPIIFLHGLASSLHTWEAWMAGLQGQRRVIAMDLPGFGLTGPSPQADYRIDAYNRFILQLLDTLGIQHAIIAGNGLGGEIAWQVALLAPKRITGLILVDAYGYPVSPLSVPLAFRLAAIPAMQWFTDRILPRAIVENSVHNVFGDPTRVSSSIVDRYFELTLRVGNRAALRTRFEQTADGSQAQNIQLLRVPTLILWGNKDRLVPPQHAERFKSEIANSQLFLFDGLGHTPQEEDPQRTLIPIKHFLKMS